MRKGSLGGSGLTQKRVECEHSDSEEEAYGFSPWFYVEIQHAVCTIACIVSQSKSKTSLGASAVMGGGGPRGARIVGVLPPGPYLSSARREWCLSLVPLHG